MSEKNDVILYYNTNGENITLGKYNVFLRNNDKDAIANFIYNRLYSRYIKVFEFNNKAQLSHIDSSKFSY